MRQARTSSPPPLRPKAVILAGTIASTLLPAEASAHVKWFCTIVDVTTPPAALVQVLSPLFLSCCAGFLLLVFAGLVADGWIARLWPGLLSSGDRLRKVEELLIRVGVGAYCLCLWNRAAVVPWGHAGAILTPELLDHDRMVGALQVAVAVLVVSRRTCWLAALVLVTLVALGIARYGVFHMTDYVYFVGLAAYLALTSMRPGRPRRWRLPLLCASLGFSLMWTAIEKFLYPEWTAQILIEHPNLSAGLPVASVVVIAGFVEFSLAFYLVTGRGLLRLGAVALMAVFLSATPEFGELDTVGHLPIVAILLAIAVRGATPMQDALRLHGRGPAVNAAAVCGMYLATLSVMMAMYYAMQLTATAG